MARVPSSVVVTVAVFLGVLALSSGAPADKPTSSSSADLTAESSYGLGYGPGGYGGLGGYGYGGYPGFWGGYPYRGGWGYPGYHGYGGYWGGYPY